MHHHRRGVWRAAPRSPGAGLVTTEPARSSIPARKSAASALGLLGAQRPDPDAVDEVGELPQLCYLRSLVQHWNPLSLNSNSVTYQRGVTLLNCTFGAGLFSGGINVLLWLSYIVMLALYSQAFGSYAASFFPRVRPHLGQACVPHRGDCADHRSQRRGRLHRGPRRTCDRRSQDRDSGVIRGRRVAGVSTRSWRPRSGILRCRLSRAVALYFLIIFAAVNLAEAHTARRRESTPWISVVAALACVAALAALIAKSSLESVSVLVAMVALSFGIEATFRKISGRPIHA